MNAFQKYEAYKPSGVEWIGEIPEHWEPKPGFTVIEERKEKNKGLKENTVLSLSYGNVIVKSEEKQTGLVPESFETYQLVYPGDIIVRPTDLQNDKTSLRTGLARDKGIITSAYINLKMTNGYSTGFFHYFLHSIDVTKVIYGLGSGLRQNLDFGDFKRFVFLVPPLSEQTRIAHFLDQKTAQIDQAIAQKERLIELLKERRQILIQNAVTRGLDPNVKMKDSGVEWIGEVPEHWEVTKAKFYSNIFVPERAKPELNTENDGTPWVTTDLLRNNELFQADVTYYVSEIAKRKARSRIITAKSVIATCVGNFGISSKLNFDCIVNQQIQGFTDLRINADYLTYLIGISEAYFKNNATLTTIMYVSKDTFGCMPILLPNEDEQFEIVNHIATIAQKIATAIACKQAEIEKLKEYKATLINSAVTGKIKV
jgi:type I restriction enzyme S subunit